MRTLQYVFLPPGLFLLVGNENSHTSPLHLPTTTDSLSTMPSKHFFRDLKQRARKSRPAMSGDQAPLAAQGATVAPDSTWQIDTHDDITMGAIQTSLEALKEGSSLATELPFIAPIAGLLLQALTMRDARVTHISFDNVLANASPGSEAI
ncbi:hypothetical protein EDB92DRAFT_1927204 [Lactarius akahatsu]|uniref:Uncharacterized protein n=1 Tax=Lactarius akahatsu TaxID=416441 RepID=A0AAD4Q1Z1_9AGAM|nr:hypothetical protein EDB92DRAFT_1927204 [Lactarius akahatsu]